MAWLCTGSGPRFRQLAAEAGAYPGGAGGVSDGSSGDTAGSDGGFLYGGNGGYGGNVNEALGAGGGGGGYYGGGGGGAGDYLAGSGGGGESYIDPSATNTSGPTLVNNAAEVSITYAPPT